MITLKKDKFHGKDCYIISNGQKEAVVVTEVGARIASYKMVGQENILMCFPKDYENSEDIHKFYGGHRLWHSPEEFPRTYQPDNMPCEVQELSDGIIVSQYEKETKLTKIMEIQMNSEGRLRIIHQIKNHNLFEVTLSPWGITMLQGGGVGILPIDKEDTGYLPNRNISLWSYSKGYDKRVEYLDSYILFHQKNVEEHPFKIGSMSRRGFMGYHKDQTLFTIEYDVEEGDYPDFGCNVEVYLNEHMLELENLGKVQTLRCGESAEMVEVWDIFSQGEIEYTENEVSKMFKGKVKCEV